MIRSTANDSPPQPDLRKPARWFQNSASETRVPSVRPLCPSPSSSDDSMLASKAFLPPPPRPGSRQSLPHLLDSQPWNTLSWHPAHRLLGLHTESQGWAHATVAEGMLLSTWQRPRSLPTGQGQDWWPPQHPKKGKQKETNQKRRRAIRARGGGQGLPRAMGFTLRMHQAWETGVEEGGPEEAMGGVEGQSGGRGQSSHAAWDKSFVALSDSQSINWCLLEPGTQGSVEERRAREEMRRTGMASCPGLHFAVIICTNSS